MQSEYAQRFSEFASKGEPFAVATVIKAEGSTSAKVGSKAIFTPDGMLVWGWVGGGCAESTVGHEAVQAIREEKARLVNVDLEDEVKGVGMPCGGFMQVYVEPYVLKPELLIFGSGPIVSALVKFAHILGFEITVNHPSASKESLPEADLVLSDDLHLNQLKVTPKTFVVIATQHKSDDFYLKKVVDSPTPYIALTASKKRREIIFKALLDDGISPESLKKVRAPAGLKINSVTPEEIALSIIAEMVAMRRGIPPVEWPDDGAGSRVGQASSEAVVREHPTR